MAACVDEDERIVAILHDVVEGGKLTLSDLRHEGLREDLIAALDAMTRRKGETYADFIDRVASHPIARTVKIAGLRDRLAIDRIEGPTDRELQQRQEYLRALRRLGVSEG